MDRDRRLVPGGEASLEGVVKWNPFHVHLLDERRGADRAVQPAGEREKLCFDRCPG